MSLGGLAVLTIKGAALLGFRISGMRGFGLWVVQTIVDECLVYEIYVKVTPS